MNFYACFNPPASLWCLFISHILITGYSTYSVFSIRIPFQQNWRQEKSQVMVFVPMLQTGNDGSQRKPIDLMLKCVFGCCFGYKTVLKETYNKGEVDKLTALKGSREVV